ncbi:hypothetical protein WOLCODRAFT_79174, partial [Wolfiporia cocos MD-104 SS10]
CYVNSYEKNNWAQLLLAVEFAYNNTASETTKNSPFLVELRRYPHAGPANLTASSNADLNDIALSQETR